MKNLNFFKISLFVFGMLFSFSLSSKHTVFAADVPTFGIYSGSGYSVTPTLAPCPTSGNLYDFIDVSFSEHSNIPLTSSEIVNIISSSGLDYYFHNFDIYNPLFYCNLNLHYFSSSSDGYLVFTFFDSNLDNPFFISSDGDYSGVTNYVFSSGSYFISSWSVFPSPLYSSFNPDLATSYIVYTPTRSDVYSELYVDSFSGITFSSIPSTYDNFSQSFYNHLLTLSSDGFFSLFLYFDSSHQFISSKSGLVSNAYIGLGGGARAYPIFSFCKTYFVSSLGSTTRASLQHGFTALYSFCPSEPSVSSFSFPLTVPFSPVSPTPSPIPTLGRPTLTPFPTVPPLDVSLTPIPNYLNPDVITGFEDQDTITQLTGYAAIVDSVFSSSVFACGRFLIEYLYVFSPYFRFVLIIPIICLLAYVVGRLNQR